MKRILFTVLTGWIFLHVSRAQTLENVLRSVERNNKELAALRKGDEASRVGIDAENSLEDPSVEYISQYNREVAGQATSELVVSQGFDFPTVYGARNREGRERKEAIAFRYEAQRRQILLEAQKLCFDLIRLDREMELLHIRQGNADALLQLYEERLQAGDVTRIEVNKIKMERMNLQTEVLRNRSARRSALTSLTALNGNVPVGFTVKDYPVMAVADDYETLLEEILGGEAEIHAADAELRASERAVTVNRQKWLPHIEVGYRRNTSVEGPKEHGFIVGGSIPLFSNHRQVKMARLQSEEARMTLDDVRSKAESEVYGLYQDMQEARHAMEVYDVELMRQTLDLLKEGVEKGEISAIDYFMEADPIYQNLQAFMEIENDYYKTLATLCKHRL